MLKFIEKNSRGRLVEECDCSVGNYEQKGKHYGIVVTFYNYSWKRILQSDEYIVSAFENGKIYFKKSDKRNGYKLTHQSPTSIDSTKKYHFPTDVRVSSKKYGYLEFDKNYGLYYLTIE